MKETAITLVLAVLAVSGLGALGVAAFAPLHQAVTQSGEASLPTGKSNGERPPSKAWAVRAPFRRGRTSAPQPFDARGLAVATEQVVQVERPRLILRGFVVGTRRAAVIEGLPGIEGARVLRQGDEEAGVRVARIEGDRVVVRMKDTTWALKVGEPGS